MPDNNLHTVVSAGGMLVDITRSSVLSILSSEAPGVSGMMGVNVNVPTEALDVKGNVQVTGDFIDTGGGKSSQWHSAFMTVNAFSGQWDNEWTNLGSIWSTVSSNSANWQGAHSTANANSAIWNEIVGTKATVANTSAFWKVGGYAKDTLSAASGAWESVYDNVKDLSGEWESTFETVRDLSSEWQEDDQWAGIHSLLTTVSSNSTNWDTVFNNVKDLSAWQWQGTYDTVNTVSATWNEAEGTKDTVQSTSATWNEAEVL